MKPRSLFLLSVLAVFIGPMRAEDRAAPAPRLNRYIELMEAQKPAFGIFSSVVSTRNGAAMAGRGLDFVIVDQGHSPYDLSKLEGRLLGMVSNAEILREAVSIGRKFVPKR